MCKKVSEVSEIECGMLRMRGTVVIVESVTKATDGVVEGLASMRRRIKGNATISTKPVLANPKGR